MTEARTTHETDELDRIERSVDIDAPAERVWELIRQPGWWINSSSIISNQVVTPDDDDPRVSVVHDAQYGDFRIRTVTLDEPRYAAFRWLGDDASADGPSTLVEFRIEDRPGGVVLRVTESGFSSLSDDRETWLASREENVEGWGIELEAARAHFDPQVVQRSIRVELAAEQLWPWLTEGDRLARWYAFDGAEVDPRVGGAMALRWAEHGTFRAVVEEVDEPATFAFRLCHVPDADPAPGNSTRVTFSLTREETPSGEVCLLTVRETGFTDLDPALGRTAAMMRDETQGWDAGLAALTTQLSEAVR